MQHHEPDNESGDIDYVAVFEAHDVHPDGSWSEDTRLILDAIPCSVLDRLGIAQIEQTTNKNFPLIDFFLLTLKPSQKTVEIAAELGGYINITVTRQTRNDDEEMLAFATGLNGIDNDNIPFFVRIRRTPPKRQHLQTLRQLANLSHIKDSDNLPKIEQRDYANLAVAVYDVGQGSMCALVNKHEHPLMFFDLGWPLSFFARSIPQTHSDFNPFPPNLATLHKPVPVVLSHLDWDHWAYAIQSGRARWDNDIGAWKTVPVYRPEALSRPWLMRRPNYRHKLGGSHIHFVQTLAVTHTNGNPALHFWPKGLQHIALGPIILFLCSPATGTSKDPYFLRNNQGLGILVEDAFSGARVLIAGDADFPSIPSFAKQRLTGMVAPHHGGHVTTGSVPSAVGHGRMVMSVYPGSYRNIPHSDVELEAKTKGWRITYTSERQPCFRSNKAFNCGHRLIRLARTPFCSCTKVPTACLCISRHQ